MLLREKLSCVFGFLFIVLSLKAQVKIAVIENNDQTSPVIKHFQDSLYHRLTQLKGVEHYIYYLQADSLVFDPYKSSRREETVPDLVMWMWIHVFENPTPALTITRAEGKPPTAHFSLSKRAEVRVKYIDYKTQQIVHIAGEALDDAIPVITSLDMTERDGIITAGNYKSYFPMDPDYMKVNRPREYATALARMHKEYESRFRAFHLEKREDVLNMIIGTEMSCLYPGPMVCSEVVMENDKAKKVHVPLPMDIALPQHAYMEVFSLDTIRQYVVPDQYGVYYVDDYRNGTVILDGVLGSKTKQAGEAYMAGKKLYASFSDYAISGKLEGDKEDVRIGTSFPASRIFSLEEELSRLKDVTLTDMGTIEINNRLRKRFMHAPVTSGADLVKERGLHYVFQASGESVQLVETSGHHTVATYDANLGLKGFMDEAMELFGKEIEVVDITKEKNGKAQKIRLFSPLGFQGDHVLTINLMSGNTATEIGTCSEFGAHHSIAEFSITRGEDAVYKAITGGQTLRFRNKTFRLFGNDFK